VWDSVANPYDRGCCLNYVDMCCMSPATSHLQCMSDPMEKDDFLAVLGPAYLAKREKARIKAERGRAEAQAAFYSKDVSPTTPTGRKGGLATAAGRVARALSPTGMASAIGRLSGLAPSSPPSGSDAAVSQGPNSPLMSPKR
jgi:hypothetical protein